MKNKEMNSNDAVKVIQDGDTVLVSGFVGIGTPDELLIALENRFLETGHPRDLTVVFAAAPGDAGDRGLNRLAHSGLIKRAIGGHWSLVPKLAAMAVNNEIEAYNLPLGCISQMYRVIAGGKPGLRTKVGLCTFVDPRLEGGRMNECTTEEMVSLDYVDGEEWLFYRSFPIDVAFLRGTTSDTFGNTTMEREVLILDVCSSAMATRNSGGIVMVQAERVAERGSLLPKTVNIPGNLVDCVVKSNPENHCQTYATPYEHAFSGNLRVSLADQEPLPMDVRKIIARRAAMELPVGGVINLGIGVPEGVAKIAAEEDLLDCMTLTAEAGTIGGVPQSGLDFGAALNPDAIIPTNSQFDFYDGGGLNMACLGMAQVDQAGNVNVSKFGTRFAGAGGFINISQNAERLVLAGSFTAGGFNAEIKDGELKILQEGKTKKFISKVEHVTFSGNLAAQRKQEVLYVTERCVFKIQEKGVELIEIAPGIDLEKDILLHMDFKPIMNDIRLMDSRIFIPEIMDLRKDMIDAPISKRIAVCEKSGELKCNFRGYEITKKKQIDMIEARIIEVCSALKGRVHCQSWYDDFFVSEKYLKIYTKMINSLGERYFSSVSYCVHDPFLRLQLISELHDLGFVVESKEYCLLGNYEEEQKVKPTLHIAEAV